MTPFIIPVILSGGSGTRLWPASRALEPKQFMRLGNEPSFIQKALLRAKLIKNVNQILVVTNRQQALRTHADFLEVSADPAQYTYIFEPSAHNTGPAIVAAALQITQMAGNCPAMDTLMLVLPADHLIENEKNFIEAVETAGTLAAQGKLVTFGIKPTRPETGFGYIEYKGFEVTRFVEKPDLEKAKQFLEAGNFCWNAGMFCFRIGTLLDELAIHAPQLLTTVQAAWEKAKVCINQGSTQIDLNTVEFSRTPNISIDYALMEKSAKVAVVQCDLGWSDVGSWKAIAELQQADSKGNRVVGKVVLHDTENCYVQSDNRLIAAVGLRDLIVVDTPDALLLAHQDQVQEVKQIVQQLNEAKHASAEIHLTAYRPWGSYTVLEESKHHKIKRLLVKPKGALSLQMHHHRSEHWVVVDGTACVVNGDEEFILKANQSTYIPAGQRHRLSNPGDTDLVLIEVQTGTYLGEDDIVRFEDIYGRLLDLS
ncbi:MAG: mannose-1-phosphate guanylyltransferase/mannose-6-phosphate isomerase [Burkholderiaceae bacterium]|nr:mannose-1-phosphate guanylyltransferase/mannose-6-phosphate isomerase [Burkholderiaceae bacterium]